MDMKLKVKKELLQDLIDRMKELEVDGLKSKSPKFAKVDIASNDPELAEEIKEKVMDKAAEESDVEPAEGVEEEAVEEIPEKEEDEEDDEDMDRLMELYRKLK